MLKAAAPNFQEIWSCTREPKAVVSSDRTIDYYLIALKPVKRIIVLIYHLANCLLEEL